MSLENVAKMKTRLQVLELLTALKLSKDLDAFVSQVAPRNVVRFFKCMEISCDFCGDEADSFVDHLRTHALSLTQCTYCNELDVNEENLVEHMIGEHGSSRYQCALCFYRSETLTHMRVHSIVVHKSKDILWYVCKARAPRDPNPISHEIDHVAAYTCKDCSFRSRCTERFFNHVTVVHSSPMAISCAICTEQMGSPATLINHYKKAHCTYTFNCFYCDFGSEVDWDVFVHVTMCHPAKSFYIFCRGKDMPPTFRALKDFVESSTNDGIPGSFSQQSDQDKQPSLNSSAIHVPVKIDMLVKSSDPGNDRPTSGLAMSKTKCKCGAIYNDVGMFFAHITKKHSQERGFECPNCSLLTGASLGDLFAHIVDFHAAFFRCCHKNSICISESQQIVDEHVIQAHQRTDSPGEDTTQAQQKEICFRADSGITCLGNLISKTPNMAVSLEKSTEEKKSEHLLESGIVYACNLCCHSEMQQLDYFRHMSLDHGIKFFCGHCKKGYKLWKQMTVHHSSCHSELELSVKSFERNKLKDVASGMQSDCDNELQGGVGKKCAKSKGAELGAVGSAAGIDPRKRDNSLPSALHYAHMHEGALLTSSKVPKRVLGMSRVLAPTPLGNDHATCSQQKEEKARSSSSTTACQQKSPDNCRQTDDTGPGSSRSSTESLCYNGSNLQSNVRRSYLAASVQHRGGPLKENIGRACSEASNACGLDSQEGFSYYGKPVEPIDIENTYIYFHKDNVRIAYCQVATIVNFSPIVLVRKEA